LPVPGANDGASGVAVLLGVADALKAKPPALGVDLLFVDGEDYGNFATDSNDVLIGSRYFASHQPPGYQPLFAVLFDMVADKDQQFYYEGNSQAFAPEVVDRVWRTAADLGYGRIFLPGVKYPLIDDQVALQHVGIHAIDVVDFDYPYWHTTEDTIDKVSAASLQVVGDVAVALVREKRVPTSAVLIRDFPARGARNGYRPLNAAARLLELQPRGNNLPDEPRLSRGASPMPRRRLAVSRVRRACSPPTCPANRLRLRRWLCPRASISSPCALMTACRTFAGIVGSGKS
jgi:Zn-dependent M28 family amino/carboxypeptidase